MIEELRQHIDWKFSESQLEFYPFPHLISENFFPDEVFQKILKYNLFKHNVGTEWLDRKQSSALKTGTPYEARKQINFHTKQELIATEEEKEFWDQIKACFLKDRWFENVVLDKYKDYFIIRFGELIESTDFFQRFQRQLFLQRHDPGYYIGSHTDVPTRVFTCIFSFADRAGFEEYGTQLCVHKDPTVRCWGNNHYSSDDFIVRKVAPYKPNNFLLFFKTRQSFHAVKTIDESVPNQRYGMQFQLYEPPRGVFRDLSAPDLLTMKHHKKGTQPKGDSTHKQIKKLAKSLLSKK